MASTASTLNLGKAAAAFMISAPFCAYSLKSLPRFKIRLNGSKLIEPFIFSVLMFCDLK